jgi:hypothetical protein
VLSRIRARTTYANVVSTLCMFVLLGGGAYAATKITSKDLAKNAVRSKHIKDGQVNTRDLKANAVHSAQVADGAIGADDLGPGSVTSVAIADGAIGADDLAADERVHVVGTPGEPGFGTGGQEDCIWSAASTQVEPPSFFKDKAGIVHLGGLAASADHAGPGDGTCSAPGSPNDSTEDGIIFVLPPAYRPVLATYLPGYSTVGPVPSFVVIGQGGIDFGGTLLPAGAVFANTAPGGSQQELGGVSFLSAGAPSAAPLRAAVHRSTDENGASADLGALLGG